MVESVKKNLQIPANNVKRLKVSNSRPAQITFTIKDHKDKKGDGSYPVRPIASVHNTLVDGLDWLLQEEMSPAVERVTANLDDAAGATLLFDELNLSEPPCGWVRQIFSLDVVNLYPSLDTERFAPQVADFVFDGLDNTRPGVGRTGLSKNQFLELLLFTCRHYEVESNKKTYLQSFGVPMGARFAPPFAIIAMHAIERRVLADLNMDGIVRLYRRYIDDILVVVDSPVHSKDNVRENFVGAFNRAEEKVKFTIECPGSDGGLPFLDMYVGINPKGKVVYEWYQKSTHSGFLMHRLAFFDRIQKMHFMINRFIAVFERNNTCSGLNKGVNKMHALLLANGYSLQEVNRSLVLAANKHNDIRRLAATPTPVEGLSPPVSGDRARPRDIRRLMGTNPLKIPYVSKEFHGKVRRLVRDLNLPLRVITGKCRQVGQLGPNPVPTAKCLTRCQICRALPEKMSCRMGNLVYEACCKKCGESYIGKTARNLYCRLSQHKFELDHMDAKGPLPAHLQEHEQNIGGLGDFDFRVMARGRGGVEVAIKEALCIDCYRPSINRKEEKQFFM